MTETTMAALIGAVPPTLAAIAALLVGMVNKSKANAIHVLVNDRMTKMEAALAVADQRIEVLLSKLPKAVNGS